MAKAWIITRGEYSDYHIVAVYSNKKKAEEVAANIRAREKNEFLERHDLAELDHCEQVYYSGQEEGGWDTWVEEWSLDTLKEQE